MNKYFIYPEQDSAGLSFRLNGFNSGALSKEDF